MRDDDTASLNAERAELKKALMAEQGLSDGEADQKVNWGRDAVSAGTDAFLGAGQGGRSWKWTAVGFAALAGVAILILLFGPHD